jgi:hypothetical protein
VDSIAELDLLRSIGVSVAVEHTRVCGMADSGHRLRVKLGSALLHASDQRVIYNSFVRSDMDSASAVRSIGIESRHWIGSSSLLRWNLADGKTSMMTKS